jgi:glycosyltransferase involved in cell wall biosynthesis
VLAHFDRVYTSSQVERDSLPAVNDGAGVAVLPNVAPSVTPVPPPPGGGPFTMLFVGTLASPVNEDAVLAFCRDVWPRLRGQDRPMQLIVVGAGTTPRVRSLAGTGGVTVVGAVPDVTPWYARAHAVVVPLRAGGGTRLKVLEAMAHGRAVVATSTGVLGLDVLHDGHVLIGDGPVEFAAHCLRLAGDAALASRLTEASLGFVRRRHSSEALVAALRDADERKR